MRKKLVVCGLPRSGTSLMMRLVYLSGYKVLYCNKFSEKLGRFRTNDWFYEHPVFSNGDGLQDVNGAVKVLVWGLDKVPKDFKIIWIERNKEDVIKSWKSYDRQKLNKSKYTEQEEYEKYMEMGEVLSEYDHVKIKYENLCKTPEKELKKLEKIGVLIKPQALKEIKCK